MAPALQDGLPPLGAEGAPPFASPSELQREHLWLLLASLLASYWAFGFCCREAAIFYRRKPWKGELHWLYSITVANLFFLLCVYLSVETAQLIWELNRTFSGDPEYIQTTRYVVSLHSLVLAMGGFAELFFLYRACLVMDSLRWKLVKPAHGGLGQQSAMWRLLGPPGTRHLQHFMDLVQVGTITAGSTSLITLPRRPHRPRHPPILLRSHPPLGRRRRRFLLRPLRARHHAHLPLAQPLRTNLVLLRYMGHQPAHLSSTAAEEEAPWRGDDDGRKGRETGANSRIWRGRRSSKLEVRHHESTRLGGDGERRDWGRFVEQELVAERFGDVERQWRER
ncbi:hypothetical protein BCR35DRAFT_175711 [Leucosporidium creatinivorum]|uniref:Uncharacterized protein n=1 Tax=Leucosporidium creatinivorum TaxID=106004 RepID=A0A1Y2G0Y2_9BASI|nr:hypothetical protein BCR35DRAFT_175711 [Leucosporidium creatinivorum]